MMPFGNFAQLGDLSGFGPRRPMMPFMGMAQPSQPQPAPTPTPTPQTPLNFGGDGGPRPVSDPRMSGPVAFAPTPAPTPVPAPAQPPQQLPPNPAPSWGGIPDSGTFGTPAPAQAPPNPAPTWGSNWGIQQPTNNMAPGMQPGQGFNGFGGFGRFGGGMMPLRSLMGY